MGISQTKNLGVKNPRIQKYFDQFVKFGFCKSRVRYKKNNKDT